VPPVVPPVTPAPIYTCTPNAAANECCTPDQVGMCNVPYQCLNSVCG